jgi:ribosomal protein S18 acetylase RimI-like enzyme
MDIKYRIPTSNELGKVSEQITISYTTAYKELMDREYLSSMSLSHWEPILQDSMNRGDTCLIAECDGNIIGSTVFGKRTTEENTCAEWHAIYLLPQYTRIGVGHLFYEVIETEMIKQGYNSCVLEVLSANTRAIRFYLSHGFIKTNSFTVHENGMILLCDNMTKIFPQI